MHDVPAQLSGLVQQDLPGPFVRDLIRSLAEMYERISADVQYLPVEYRKTARSQRLWMDADLTVIRLADQHGLRGGIVKSRRRGQPHALGVAGSLLFTLSKTEGPHKTPRPSNYRLDYATYASMGNYPLPGEDFAFIRPPIAVLDQTDPAYVLITHGPDASDWARLGFVYVHEVEVVVIPGTSYKSLRYTGRGINLLDDYGSAGAAVEEIVPEPELRFEDNPASLPRSG